MQELVTRMHVSHYETLRHLLGHLCKVCEQSKENRMNVQNIALLFGPNLMRGTGSAGNDPAAMCYGFSPNIMAQNLIVEYMITNFNHIFPLNSSSSSNNSAQHYQVAQPLATPNTSNNNDTSDRYYYYHHQNK